MKKPKPNAVLRYEHKATWSLQLFKHPKFWLCFIFGHNSINAPADFTFKRKLHSHKATHHRTLITVPYCTACESVLTCSVDVATALPVSVDAEYFDQKCEVVF